VKESEESGLRTSRQVGQAEARHLLRLIGPKLYS
jgi:hypothetical protein